jgi:hypothetical protein
MQYANYIRNHVVVPGSEEALKNFLSQRYGKLRNHKWRNRFNSNSEDALTWSCFDILRNHLNDKIKVLSEIWEDAYQGEMDCPISNKILSDKEIKIEIGKKYTGATKGGETEVDASIEFPGGLVFIEAKLYSPMSIPESIQKPNNQKYPKEPYYNQIARKLRVGLDKPEPFGDEEYDFYFIFLDIAPRDKLILRKSKKEAEAPSKGFHDKWKSAWWFNYYKDGRNNSHKPLENVLNDIPPENKDLRQVAKNMAKNMGWLTWADLFKDLLKGMI